MSSLDHRLQRLEDALTPRSKGHRIVMGGGPRSDWPSAEAAEQEAARLRHEGYEVTLILFAPTEQAAVRQFP